MAFPLPALLDSAAVVQRAAALLTVGVLATGCGGGTSTNESPGSTGQPTGAAAQRSSNQPGEAPPLDVDGCADASRKTADSFVPGGADAAVKAPAGTQEVRTETSLVRDPLLHTLTLRDLAVAISSDPDSKPAGDRLLSPLIFPSTLVGIGYVCTNGDVYAKGLRVASDIKLANRDLEGGFFFTNEAPDLKAHPARDYLTETTAAYVGLSSDGQLAAAALATSGDAYCPEMYILPS